MGVILLSSRLEAFLNSLNPRVLNLMIKLRVLIIGSNPDAVELVYPSWKTIGYGLDRKMSGQVCFIQALDSGVKLGFNRGSLMQDPKKVLQGSDDLLRYLVIQDSESINMGECPGFVEIRLAGSKSPIIPSPPIRFCAIRLIEDDQIK